MTKLFFDQNINPVRSNPKVKKSSHGTLKINYHGIHKYSVFKIISLIAIICLLATGLVLKPASALISQNVTSWFWTDTTNIAAIATGDVNGDGKTEIVTAGWYLDGLRYNAQLVVWNASNLAVEKVASWFWTAETEISSVAIGDVNGDGQMEIVTGGSYFDGTRYNAQLCIWNGSTLALEKVMGWYWTYDTQISSVALANITSSAGLDIVTGGTYNDGTRNNAQLCVWNGSTLALEKVTGWYWTSDTWINSVATGDINGTGAISIVTGGSYFDGTRINAQIASWNGSTLANNNIASWYWTGDTQVNSVAVANVTGGTALSIIGGGNYNDGTRANSQLTVWNGSTFALQNVASWFTTSNTKISSVTTGNFSSGNNLDIITTGTYNDGVKNNAQLNDFNGGTLVTNSATNWFTSSSTEANAVALGNFGLGNRVVVGGAFFDAIRDNAQLTIWG